MLDLFHYLCYYPFYNGPLWPSSEKKMQLDVDNEPTLSRL